MLSGQLEELLDNIKIIGGDNFVGLYLYGSLVWSDFETKLSDIDLLTVVPANINDVEFKHLEQMNKSFSNKHQQQWRDRINSKSIG